MAAGSGWWRTNLIKYRCPGPHLASSTLWTLLTRAANDPSVFTITKKVSTMTFSWLKALMYLLGTPTQGSQGTGGLVSIDS